jgi:hypothetical protein
LPTNRRETLGRLQTILGGKAHPKDQKGKDFDPESCRLCRCPRRSNHGDLS